MAGASLRHSHLACRIGDRLEAALGVGPCSAFESDLRLGIEDAHVVYADAVVACRPFALRPGTADVVTNPRVVVEVPDVASIRSSLASCVSHLAWCP
jgi:hypothetical protein